MWNKILPWAIVGVLVVLLLWSLNTESGEPVVITERHTDTLTIVRHDTVEVTKVVTKVEKEPADTVYITVRDSIFVPVPRKDYTFSESNLFDFRVRGFDVEFLGANVYPKTVYETIYEQSTTTVANGGSSLFVLGGFSSVCGDFSPKVGLGLSLKGRWLISGDFGFYKKEPMWSVTVGYNVLQK